MADEARSASGSRRTKMAVGVVVIAVGAAAIGVVAGRQLQSPADAAAAAKAPEASRITVPVEKRTLVSRLIANGDVQYTEPTNLRLAGAVGASGGATQVVTKAPELDTPLDEGDVAMEVSGRPVFVFEGALPTYRPLEPGSTGPDVLQLEEALARLGTFGGTGRVVTGHGTDLGQGFVDAAEGQLGAFPTKCAPAKPGAEGPGSGCSLGGCGHGGSELF